MASDYLYGEVDGFRCDVEALRRYYAEVVSAHPPQPYYDHGASYAGWAVTSRDGTIHEGVQYVARKSSNRDAPSSNRRGVVPTPLYAGPVKDVLDGLMATGLRPYRARIMALDDHDFDMKWHRDAERENWRLHVPIITNPHCFFEWKGRGGWRRRVHLPADGRAWFVRVDQIHRAVNDGAGLGVRVHLLMSLRDVPRSVRLGPDACKVPDSTEAKAPSGQPTPPSPARP